MSSQNIQHGIRQKTAEKDRLTTQAEEIETLLLNNRSQNNSDPTKLFGNQYRYKRKQLIRLRKKIDALNTEISALEAQRLLDDIPAPEIPERKEQHNTSREQVNSRLRNLGIEVADDIDLDEVHH